MTPEINGWTSELAIDNKLSLSPDLCNCCSGTEDETPWWQIDFGQPYVIVAIEVLSRADAYYDGDVNQSGT